ncbi:MAG: protein kinase [Pirellulales bacterium]
MQDPLIGTLVGEVTIVREIAEGGMGRVYEGLQDKPRRPVAVKIVRPGALSADARRRFENESEVLGRLRHPYIAQVYSAGICTVLGAHVPYFVMELIDGGLPLTEYAEAQSLSFRERVDLFCKVCDAVAHGHRNNIVHRDLKPSNILVDDTGLPKVIDFGVARCLHTSSDAEIVMTSTGQIIGTLQYMSPEQFAGDSTHVDARADVYALGVILHELLTGKAPYDLRGKHVVEAAAIVQKHKPVSPSQLNPKVTPAIAKVVDTALLKDPRQRFANAGDLCEAITSGLSIRNSTGDTESPEAAGLLEAFYGSLHSRWTFVYAGVLLIAAGAVLAIARTFASPEKAGLDAQLFVPPPVIAIGNRRYEVVFSLSTRTQALDACKRMGGRLADIRTSAQFRAITAAALKAGCGPTYLWANADPRGDTAWPAPRRPITFEAFGESTGFVAISLTPPTASWEGLNEKETVGGFVCEWQE